MTHFPETPINDVHWSVGYAEGLKEGRAQLADTLAALWDLVSLVEGIPMVFDHRLPNAKAVLAKYGDKP